MSARTRASFILDEPARSRHALSPDRRRVKFAGQTLVAGLRPRGNLSFDRGKYGSYECNRRRERQE